jgi:membrane fusion protein, multidrug efflux system
MKRLCPTLVVLSGILACVIPSGCTPVAAKSEPPPPRVTVQHPQLREITDYSEYNGWTDASKTVEVRSRVRGYIHEVPFTDGQVVEQGQLLFKLDPRPFETEIESATQQIEVDQANLEFAQAEEERFVELFEKKITTKAEMQQKVAMRKSWEAKLAAAKEGLKRTKLDLEYSQITAPIKGKIGRAQMDVGNLVNAGGSDPLLTTIVALDPMYVYFFVDERALLEYRERNGVTAKRNHEKPLKESEVPFDFALETDKGFPNHGMLDFADNRIDSKTGTIEVRGTVSNPNGQFLPGSRVRVRIPVSEKYSALVVPDTAILSDQALRYLLVLNKENVVIRRNVELGRLLEDGQRVIRPVSEGAEFVTADDWVIVQGLQRARLNYAVEPMNADGETITK